MNLPTVARKGPSDHVTRIPLCSASPAFPAPGRNSPRKKCPHRKAASGGFFRQIFLAGGILSAALCTTVRADSDFWLDEQSLETLEQECLSPRSNTAVTGNPLSIAGTPYARGIGFNAPFHWQFQLDGNASELTALAGAPKSGKTTIFLRVICDGRTVLDRQFKPGEKPVDITIPLAGVKTLQLVGDPLNAKWTAHFNLADAKISYRGLAPVPLTFSPESEEKVVLTPPPGDAPEIHSARVFGARPGNEVLYRIAASGIRPMTFSAEGLPEGLSLDSRSGQISGVVKQPGSYAIKLTTENAGGQDHMLLRLEIGDRLALTPPMGWNSWNIWARLVSDEKVRAAAKAMVDTGLINYGWQYINIDDCWMRKPGSTDPETGEPVRCDNCGDTMRPNARFPDMADLTSCIHGLGLKAGIYASPGKRTCQLYEGCLGHEALDAQTFADWGFDFLKYDWCNYAPNDQRTEEVLRRPYLLMGKILEKLNRDIVFDMCQYGMGKVSTWGAETGAQCWRVGSDLKDTWSSIVTVVDTCEWTWPYAGPGRWNDLDMMLLGILGWDEKKEDRSQWGKISRPTHLSPNEQYTHMTLWCMMAQPLLLGNDLGKMDAFTLGLLTNPEVIGVDQDPLGKQARVVKREGPQEVWLKELDGGDFALALVNRGYVANTVTADFPSIGLPGTYSVRDLWRRQDVDTSAQMISRDIPRHGCHLFRLVPAGKKDGGQSPPPAQPSPAK